LIKIAIDEKAVAATVDKLVPTWRGRARDATEKNTIAGRHLKDRDGLWSEIKSVFVGRQNRKCGYCERMLGSSGIEWDMEHFRPKRRIRRWTSASPGVVDIGDASDVGYFRLAFDTRNYLVSCKPCNTIYKSDFFPTAAPRQLATDDPAVLGTESPYLINPADPDDIDPERLIGFAGMIPIPVAISGSDRVRALVTIELLNLARPDLIRDRAEVIIGVWSAIQLLAHPTVKNQEIGQKHLEWLCSDGSRHANCARYFRRLWAEDPDAAQAVVELAGAQLY
jgi:hypothetical protein